MPLLPCSESRNVAVRPDSLDSSSSDAMTAVKSATPTIDATSGRRWQNRMYMLFLLIVLSCAFGLLSVATLIQRQDKATSDSTDDSAAAALVRLRSGVHPLDATRDTQVLVLSTAATNTPAPVVVVTDAPAVDALLSPSPEAPATPAFKKTVAERWAALGDDLSQFECVAWRRTSDCSPAGALEATETQSCDDDIPDGISGYCELQHTQTGATHRVLEMYCDSLRPGVRFKCRDWRDMLEYGKNAPLYVHDASFSFAKCRDDLVNDQTVTGIATTTALAPLPVSFARGIALVVYDKLLESVFASIRSLRAMGCTLPIELWYIASETNVQHPILQTLVRSHGAYLREIKDHRATRFYTKLHATFYSAFDQVLLLDADNFAVRDPTFLFDSVEFVSNGAIFWPDFWRPKKTIFNIQPRSFVWDVFDLDSVDAFEQESGQVLVDRTRNIAAMNVMMYYAMHADLIENLRLVWGDKDLFRFAWMKTQSPFHMIAMPPGAAGRKLPDKNVFCGVTMVQHDPNHTILFLHRNQEKLSSANYRVVWEHVQDFRMLDVSIDEYDVRGANGGRYYPDYKRCYGKDIYYEKLFTVTPIAEMPFAGLESQLLAFAAEAAALTKPWLATLEPIGSVEVHVNNV